MFKTKLNQEGGLHLMNNCWTLDKSTTCPFVHLTSRSLPWMAILLNIVRCYRAWYKTATLLLILTE